MPLSYSLTPVVDELTVMVAVGTAHVGLVAVAVTTGALGAVFTVASVEASQPAAFFTHTLWAPGDTEVKPPLG